MAGVSPESSTSGDHGDGVGGMRESERVLPVVSIGRIMRKALVGNGKIAREARDFMQECVTEFISFITCEAIDKCQRERRKVITGDDLVWAMASLGFEDYVEPLKLYLQLYREGESRGLRSCDQSAKKIGTDNGNTEESGAQKSPSTSALLGDFRVTDEPPILEAKVSRVDESQVTLVTFCW